MFTGVRRKIIDRRSLCATAILPLIVLAPLAGCARGEEPEKPCQGACPEKRELPILY